MTFDPKTEMYLNQVNGSTSALGEGSFKRRDELRRAEALERNKIRMGERLDRNISRAIRHGDAKSAASFLDTRQKMTGQGYQGRSGIMNHDDREQRVKDGAVKGANYRFGIGNVGANENPIADAPPPTNNPQAGGPSSSPSRASQIDPSLRAAEKDLWTKPKPGDPNEYHTGPDGQVTGTMMAPGSPQATPSESGIILSPDELASRRKFASELDRSPSAQSDPAARERAYQRGEKVYGVSRDEVDQRQGWNTSAGGPSSHQPVPKISEEDSKIEEAIGNLDPSKFSPAQIAEIRKNMAGFSPEERKGFVATGKAAGEAWGKRVDETLDRARGTASEVQSGIDDVNNTKGEMSAATVRSNRVLEKNREAMASLDEAGKQRELARQEGFDRSNQKFDRNIARIDQADAAERGIMDEYNKDMEATRVRNVGLGGLLVGIEPYPDQPEPINRDTFDPANPPKYERKVSPITYRTPQTKWSENPTAKLKEDAFDWVKPGIDPYGAKQALMENNGYTSKQADAILAKKGVTMEARNATFAKAKERASKLQESIDRSASAEFKESVRKNPPIVPEWMDGSILGKAYSAFQDPARIKEYGRQKEEARQQEIQRLDRSMARLEKPNTDLVAR